MTKKETNPQEETTTDINEVINEADTSQAATPARPDGMKGKGAVVNDKILQSIKLARQQANRKKPAARNIGTHASRNSWEKMYVYSYGETQLFQRDGTKNVKNESLTRLEPLFTHLAAIPDARISKERMKQLAIFPTVIEYRDNKGKKQRIEVDEPTASLIKSLADELTAHTAN